MWLQNPKLWLDITTYCNAACPQCHRTNPDTLEKADWLPLLQWDFETFKKAFPVPSAYQEFVICGTWGDPMMNKDIVKIISFIADNSHTPIVVNTNGSLRTPEWWWRLGEAGGDQLTVIFDVDGIDQDMHSHYRQKTDLDVVLEHIEELSMTPASAQVSTVLFKHNQEYLGDISKMVKQRGVVKHVWWPSDRFGQFNNWKTTFMSNKVLEPASSDKLGLWTDHKYQMEIDDCKGHIDFRRVLND